MRVLFACMATVGHTYPLIPLASALRNAGHEVHFAVGEEMHPELERLGLRPFRPGLSFGEIYAGDIAPELERVLPDLVISGWSVPEVFREAKRRAFPVLWHGFGRMFDDGIGLARPDGGRHLDLCPPSLQNADFTDDRILLRPVPHATPGRVPERTHEKLVYVTFGTVFGTEELLATAVGDLGRLDAQIVVATPDRWLPQAEVIKQADVVVHHGGSGTMLTALAEGVPQVVLPRGADQFGNAEALVKAGAGVRPDAVGAEAVAQCVRLLLTDGRYREAAGLIADEISHMPSPEEVADRLAEVV
ncbi:glycosyltransferase [Lentzea jiangxiensis]|uniref:UDP-glucoronosyl and UDP-glucosyl transferase n=1 Tax=Lentzea jiangxiensis TaxID=641025 RepID=A0A1H0GDJ7_9PSEU|nr:nucleotide disphospho-sugar-binding domain-containing protein [Lentzea jiangxiensis]SDO04930.1 UDP-glucoronosyl and UDP-glucosyl transferase [Lentzea jiangxiensis]